MARISEAGEANRIKAVRKAAKARAIMAERQEVFRQAANIATYRVTEYEAKIRDQVQEIAERLRQRVQTNVNHKAIALEAINKFESEIMALCAPPARNDVDGYMYSKPKPKKE